MADDTASAPPAGSEPAGQAIDDAISDASIDSLLAHVPGMEQYFGADEETKKGETGKKEAKDASAGDTEPAVTDEVLAGVEKQEEKAEDKKEPLPASVQERFDRLTAKFHESEGKFHESESKYAQAIKENEQLKTKLSGAGVRGPKPDNPLLDVGDYQELERRWMQARQAKAWATENLDGGLVEQGPDAQGNPQAPRELSGLEVRKFLVMCDAMLSEHIPQAKARLDAQADYDRQANSYYPDLKKSDSELSKTIDIWTQRLPAVKQFPDYRLIIADAVVGQQLRLQRIAAAQNGSRIKAPTLAAPSPSASPRSPQKSVLSAELLNRMATDRSALDTFSESLIGSTRKK